MYNVIHIATSRGMRDTARRRPRAAAAPAPRAHIAPASAAGAPDPGPGTRREEPPRSTVPSPTSG